MGKESPNNAEDAGDVFNPWGKIPWILGERCHGSHGNPLQYSCVGNPMEEEPDRLQSYKESDTTEATEQHGILN